MEQFIVFDAKSPANDDLTNFPKINIDLSKAILSNVSNKIEANKFSDKEILITNKKYKAVYKQFDSFEDLSKKVSKLISKGNVIGWFQGRSEFGPRALGNRSILADPRNSKMQKKLKLLLKQPQR